MRSFSVAVVGADGAGKTTICRRLVDTLERPARFVYMGVNPEASGHMLVTTQLRHRIMRRLRARSASEPGERPARPSGEDNTPRDPLRRGARAVKRCYTLIDRLADEWYRQLRVQYHMRRGRIVLFDRHFLLDFYTSERARAARLPLSRRIHAFCLTRFYPRPDLIVLLDAPGDVLYCRKGEGTPEALELRRLAYLRLAPRFDHFAVVDATRPAADVLVAVQDHIHAFTGRRAGAAGRHSHRGGDAPGAAGR